MKLNDFYTLVFIAIFSISLSADLFAQNEKKSRPNIIFIMTDDQSSIVPNADDNKLQSHPFGFNGDKDVYTPIIDGLAKNGIIFTRAYVSSSVCSPSRYSALTGRYASRCEGSGFIQQFPNGTMTRVENNTELEIG